MPPTTWKDQPKVPVLSRLCAAIAITALVAACASTTTPISEPSASAVSVGTATPTATVNETPAVEPTNTPEAATPEPTDSPAGEADVSISQQFFRSWKDSIGEVEFQVVIEVKNNGSGYASLTTSDRSYTVYQKDGSVLDTGDFTYTFPQILGPGQTGYFVDSGFFDSGTNIKNVGRMDPSISFGQSDGPAVAYSVSNVKISKEAYGDGLQVSGVVKNSSTDDATDGIVGVIFFDGSGKLLGALYDNTGINSLRAGQSKGFKTTYPGTAPLSPTQVKKSKAFAYDFSFF